MGYVVSTERLGWPPQRRLPRVFEHQGQLSYPDEADSPTATCHLQGDPESDALCGYHWEQLVEVPGQVGWADLHPDLRGTECSRVGAQDREDSTGRTHRYTFER